MPLFSEDDYNQYQGVYTKVQFTKSFNREGFAEREVGSVQTIMAADEPHAIAFWRNSPWGDCLEYVEATKSEFTLWMIGKAKEHRESMEAIYNVLSDPKAEKEITFTAGVSLGEECASGDLLAQAVYERLVKEGHLKE